MTCEKCGKTGLTSAVTIDNKLLCHDCTPLSKPLNLGWICPVCGCGQAYWNASCQRCLGKVDYTIPTTTTGGTD